MEKSKGIGAVKVIFDTSCSVAAILSNTGFSAEVFEHIIKGKVFNFYTDEMLLELKEVLGRPKFDLEKEKQDHFIHLFEEASFLVEEIEAYNVAKCRDKKDDKFLSLANQINADYIITADDDLLVLKEEEGTKIITPREFLDLLKHKTTSITTKK